MRETIKQDLKKDRKKTKVDRALALWFAFSLYITFEQLDWQDVEPLIIWGIRMLLYVYLVYSMFDMK